MTANPLESAALWGQVFEIAVKRGVLAGLLDCKLLSPEHPHLQPWRDIRTGKLHGALCRELGLLDDNVITQVQEAVAHLLIVGYGLGWTGLREYLQCLPRLRDPLTLNGLWCPLNLPNRRGDREAEALQAADQFRDAFGLTCVNADLIHRGEPAWSDFTLWFGARRRHHLLVLEFSYNVPRELPDFSRQRDHLDELRRYTRLLDTRGVFSRVCAEVKGERFELSPLLARFLGAFVSRDKPFFKLCQGASYVETTIGLLQAAGKLDVPCTGRALAVTAAGFESLAAGYGDREPDPRRELMRQLGRAYRETIKVSDAQAEARLADEMEMVFKHLTHSLPPALRKQVKALGRLPAPGEEIRFEFREAVADFHRPTNRFPVDEALGYVTESDKVAAYFGMPARQAVATALRPRLQNGSVSLRDLHAAAVVAGLKSAQRGRLNVLALEGNPGIGKTTAVRSFLQQSGIEGYLLLYVSPRVVINKDVTDKFAHQEDKSPSGILTLTTNAILIRNASVGYQALVLKKGGGDRKVDSAVVVDGVADLQLPDRFNTWFITPAEESALEDQYGGPRFRKESLNERQDLVRERLLPGVLRTLALGAQRLIQANPAVNRLVLTAAIQGYRQTENGTTINGLSRLFEAVKPKTSAGKAERRRFAGRFPRILVMLDEVAGDGAGALFVDEIASWLDDQFIEPFESDAGGSPFTVTLIIADASLGNETVLESYLAARPQAPEKVLVSHSGGHGPFRLAATQFRLGSISADVLHVMTNSFPATELEIHYRMKLHCLQSEVRDDSREKSVRERVRNQGEALLLCSARDEILTAVHSGARQIIFFAQHKDFLSRLRTELIGGDSPKGEDSDRRSGKPELEPAEVALLDSSVPPSQRKDLLQPERRDRIRVFLMTSSGARGVSFPKATCIIAAMPRFNIESSLMEVAQLIYRGRGDYSDPVSGQKVSGDDRPRQLVMLIDDFLPEEYLQEDPRLWLRRASDLLTLLLMLRGTIYTRIRGDAGLPGRDLAIVPVGLVGGNELIATMSQALETFIKEGNVFVLRSEQTDLKGLVHNALDNVLKLFSSHQLDGHDRSGRLRSYTAPRELERFCHTVSQPASSLLIRPDESSRLPPTSACIGPFWREDWSERDKVESFVFDHYRQAIAEAQRKLKGELRQMQKQMEIPAKLRDAARDLYRILAREREDARREFETLKAVTARALWLSLPVDYPRFWKESTEEDGRRTRILEESEWRKVLARTLQTANNVVPVVARYEDYPYAAVFGAPDPVRLHQVFDDRYFMASTELNLLNVLLLASNDSV